MLIDVSHFQGAINWSQTDPVIDGAYVKVTEGSSNVDPNWVTNHAGVVAGGKPVGAYHFADGGDPVTEANHFADQYLAASWQLDPVLDAEVPAMTPSWVGTFRAQFRARTRRQRFRVYTSHSYLTGQLNPAGWIDPQTTIWAARYASSLGWNHPALVLWQNTDAANIPGILGSVDGDQFMNGWTPAADQGGDMTTGLDPNDPTVKILLGAAASVMPGSAGVNPAGAEFLESYQTDQDVVKTDQDVVTLGGKIDSLITAVAALQKSVAALAAPALTGQASVNIQLAPPAGAAGVPMVTTQTYTIKSDGSTSS